MFKNITRCATICTYDKYASFYEYNPVSLHWIYLVWANTQKWVVYWPHLTELFAQLCKNVKKLEYRIRRKLCMISCTHGLLAISMRQSIRPSSSGRLIPLLDGKKQQRTHALLVFADGIFCRHSRPDMQLERFFTRFRLLWSAALKIARNSKYYLLVSCRCCLLLCVQLTRCLVRYIVQPSFLCRGQRTI